VVGLTTFGSIENSGGLAAGLNFAIPVSILQEYLDSAGVSAMTGEISQLFGEGIVYYEQAYYKNALKKFRMVSEMNPHFPGVAFYIRDAEKRMQQNEEKKSSMIGVDLLVFLLFLVGAIVLFRYLRKKGINLKR
jgi:hypothetical protein